MGPVQGSLMSALCRIEAPSGFPVSIVTRVDAAALTDKEAES